MKKVILFLLFISGLTYSQTSLGGVSILNSYGGLLHFGNNTGLKTSLQTVYDGLGNVSALQLATDSVNIVGTFTINGVGAGSGTISSIIFGNGLTGGTITSTGTVTVDTTVIANKTFLTNQYQPKGLYLIPSDSTANRTFSDLKYQVKATYLIPSDSTTNRTYSNSLYQAKATYLIPSDSTANRTYSNSLYQAKATYLIPSDSTANRTFSNAKYQAAGTYLTSETDPIFVADSNLFNSKTLTTAQLATKVNYSDSTTTFYTPTQAKSKMSYSDTTSLIATKWYEATLIPTQTGNAGLFLTTNGTNTSWATVPGGGDMLKSAYATQSGAAVDSSRFAESSNWSNIISKPTFGSMSLVDSTTYHGSASITTLGTVTTGAWHSVSVDTAYSTAKVISVAGRQGAVTLSTTDISGLGTLAQADSAYWNSKLGKKSDTSAVALRNILTTKGDLYVATGADTLTRLGRGYQGQQLQVDSTLNPPYKWVTPTVSSADSVRYLTSDFSTTSTTYVIVTGMSFAVAANTKYHIKMGIFLNSTNIGILGATFPSGAVAYYSLVSLNGGVDNSSTYQLTSGGEITRATSANAYSTIDIILVTSSTAGTFQLILNTSAGTAYVKAASQMYIHQVY